MFSPFEMVTAAMPDCVSKVDWRVAFFPFCFPSDIRDKVSPAVVNLPKSQVCGLLVLDCLSRPQEAREGGFCTAFFTKNFVGFYKRDFCAGSCTNELWEGEIEVCQIRQIADGVGACRGAFESSVFGIQTCDPLFSPRRSQALIIKGFIKETESPVENTPLLPTWMELTSFALATGCPP